ncbi:MAG: hypothetical protein LUC85_03305 [Bacteroidales bacterium]|nr:hypothetical protein [Bacteroidales bacterium]
MATYTIDRFTTKNRYLGSKIYEAETLSDAVMFTAAWASFYRGHNQSFRIDDGSGRDRVMVLADHNPNLLGYHVVTCWYTDHEGRDHEYNYPNPLISSLMEQTIFYLVSTLIEYGDCTTTGHALYRNRNHALREMGIEIAECRANFRSLESVIDLPTVCEERTPDGYGFEVTLQEVTPL